MSNLLLQNIVDNKSSNITSQRKQKFVAYNGDDVVNQRSLVKNNFENQIE